MITIDTPLIDNEDLPQMSLDQFQKILAAGNSPAGTQGAASYQAILDIAKNEPIMVALALAIFHHESTYGTQGVCMTYNTKNPGNCETLQLRRLKVGYISIPMADGKTRTFVRYGSWPDGFTDLAWRLIDPAYRYRQSGAKSAAQIFQIWAPTSDNNDPASYANKVVADLNSWLPTPPEETPVTERDPKAIWMPSSNFDAGRQGHMITHITLHLTAGTDSLNWLRGAAGGSDNTQSSATYLNERDTKLYQLVDENDTPWTDGDYPYNETGISVENESKDGQGFTDVQITDLIDLIVRIAGRRGWTRLVHPTDTVLPAGGLPAIAGTGYVVGHYQIPDPKNPSLGGGLDHHVNCPGPLFPWDHVMQQANALLGGSPVSGSDSRYFTETQHHISHGFKALWESFAENAMMLFGLPLSEEFSDANGVVVQYFERARFEWHPGSAQNPWDVLLGRVGDEAAHAAYATLPDAFAPVSS